MTPTTLFVTGSMTWTLSPALLVWMIRTLPCAVNEIDAARHAAATARHERIASFFFIIVLQSCRFLSFDSLSQHECFQRLPLRVALRLPVLPPAVKEIAAGLLL